VTRKGLFSRVQVAMSTTKNVQRTLQGVLFAVPGTSGGVKWDWGGMSGGCAGRVAVGWCCSCSKELWKLARVPYKHSFLGEFFCCLYWLPSSDVVLYASAFEQANSPIIRVFTVSAWWPMLGALVCQHAGPGTDNKGLYVLGVRACRGRYAGDCERPLQVGW
jgi:hypothetical protein